MCYTEQNEMFTQVEIQIVNTGRRGIVVVWPCTQKNRTSSLMPYYYIFTLSSLMSLESQYEG
jgi:hypothetical protein